MLSIFDSFISKVKTSPEQMLPVALVSMQLAAKFEETTGNVISYIDLNECVYPFGVGKYANLERVVAQMVDFNFNPVTPFKLVKVLLTEFAKPKYEFFKCKEKKALFVKKIIHLNIISVLDYEFYKYTSIAVAVAMIIFARFLCGLEPWTFEMERFCGVSKEKVKQIVTIFGTLEISGFLFLVLKEIEKQNEENLLIDFRNGFFNRFNTYFLLEEKEILNLF
jgi:hypothetical protein